jgi:hypothetical protein
MAGQPETKARREREARAAARRPVDPVLKREALQLAEEHGPTEASRRTGVKAATIRAWRARAAKAARPRRAPSSSRPASGAARRGEGEPPATRAEALWADADGAREGSRQAEERGDRMLARGRAAEARNAAVVATQGGERARQLEDDARSQEEHELSLARGRGEQVLEVLARCFAAVDVALPSDVAQAVLRGEEVGEEVAAAAREAARRPIRAEVRGEVLAELEAERVARRALREDGDGGEEEEEEEEAEEEMDGDPAPEEEAVAEQPERQRDRRARERGQAGGSRPMPTGTARYSHSMWRNEGG